jgi:hypothetical protein
MRAKLCPIIFASLACAQLGSPAAWSAGRPTHTLARDTRRLVLPAPAHEAQRARGGHQPAQHTPTHGHSSSAARSSHTPAHGSHHVESRHGAREEAGNHHGRHSGVRETAAHTRSGSPGRHPEAAEARHLAADTSSETSSTNDRATADRVHAWEQAQHRTAPLPVVADTPAAQALEAAGAEIAATAITPADALTSPLSRAELPRISTIEQEAATPVLLPSLYDKRGHLVVPAPLYGTHEVLVHQNLMADHDGLARVRDDDDLLDLRRQHKLVPLPEGEALRVDDRLPPNRRYSRPWTSVFLTVLARDFYANFHESLQVNSAVRTVQIQRRLLRTNGNAAPTDGETASPHLTGQAVDIGKRGLTMPQIAWMRAYLQPLIEQGKIDVEEEFQQSCFHISVYRSYAVPTHQSLAAAGLPRTTQIY